MLERYRNQQMKKGGKLIKKYIQYFVQRKNRISEQIKHHIDKLAESSLCRMCEEKGEEKGETVRYAVRECKQKTQKEYKRRHDSYASLVHWNLCKKYKLQSIEKRNQEDLGHEKYNNLRLWEHSKVRQRNRMNS